MGDPMGQGVGLAGSGTGDYEQGGRKAIAGTVLDGLALGVIEVPRGGADGGGWEVGHGQA
jgi:hypothetical protein